MMRARVRRRGCLLLLGGLVAACDNGGWPAQCPSPNSDRIWYFHATYEDRDVCATDYLVCPEGTTAIAVEYPETNGLDCGCGCVGPAETDWPEPIDSTRP